MASHRGSGGTRSARRLGWFLIRNMDDLDYVVACARPSDCLTVFAGAHLPHRGPVDDAMLSLALLQAASVA